MEAVNTAWAGASQEIYTASQAEAGYTGTQEPKVMRWMG